MPQMLHSFDYGKGNKFKGYICHEDYPIPLPDNPVLTAEVFQMAIDKTLNDIKKWRAKELQAKGDLVWKLLVGVAIVIAVLGVMAIAGAFDGLFNGREAVQQTIQVAEVNLTR